MTGEPIDVLSLVGPGACFVNTMGRDGAGTVLVAGGHHAVGGNLTVPTGLSDPSAGVGRTSCSLTGAPGGGSTTVNITTVHADGSAATAHVFYMQPGEGTEVRWLIQP